jgi:hypothetical protein
MQFAKGFVVVVAQATALLLYALIVLGTFAYRLGRKLRRLGLRDVRVGLARWLRAWADVLDSREGLARPPESPALRLQDVWPTARLSERASGAERLGRDERRTPATRWGIPRLLAEGSCVGSSLKREGRSALLTAGVGSMSPEPLPAVAVQPALETLTLRQLRVLASQRKVKGYSRLSKSRLLSVLSAPSASCQ